jgi:hypothetical protein
VDDENLSFQKLQKPLRAFGWCIMKQAHESARMHAGRHTTMLGFWFAQVMKS